MRPARRRASRPGTPRGAPARRSLLAAHERDVRLPRVDLFAEAVRPDLPLDLTKERLLGLRGSVEDLLDPREELVRAPPSERLGLELPRERVVERPHPPLEREQRNQEMPRRLRRVDSRGEVEPEPRALQRAVERVEVRAQRAPRAPPRFVRRQPRLLVYQTLNLPFELVDQHLTARERVAVPLLAGAGERMRAELLQRVDRDVDRLASGRVEDTLELRVLACDDDPHVVVRFTPHVDALPARAAEEQADDAGIVARDRQELLERHRTRQTKIAQPSTSRCQRRYSSRCARPRSRNSSACASSGLAASHSSRASQCKVSYRSQSSYDESISETTCTPSDSARATVSGSDTESHLTSEATSSGTGARQYGSPTATKPSGRTAGTSAESSCAALRR